MADTDVKTITDHEYVECDCGAGHCCAWARVGADCALELMCEQPKSAHAVSGSATKEK